MNLRKKGCEVDGINRVINVLETSALSVRVISNIAVILQAVQK
jgi:hypothetical protein